MSTQSDLAQSVIDGDWDAAAALAQAAADAVKDPQVIIFDVLQPAMEEVGRRFSEGEFFLPDMLAAGRAMTAALQVLQPLLGNSAVSKLGLVLIGTVEGDVHEIGKSMVSMFLKGSGFEVIDLGVDVHPETFVDAVKTHQPDILGLSALLTTTMPHLGKTIGALQDAGLRTQVKVVIGGAPVTQPYADMIGADGYAADAGAAASLCKRLVSCE